MPPDEPHAGMRDGAPDHRVIEAWLRDAHRRWRVGIVGWHLVIGMAVARVVHAWVGAVGGHALLTGAAAGLSVAAAGLLSARGLRSVTPLVTAAEAATPALANALQAWHERSPALAPMVEAHLARQVRTALATTVPPRPISRRRWVGAVMALALALAGPWLWRGAGTAPSSSDPRVEPRSATRTASATLQWQVTVRPPTYTGEPARTQSGATRVEALEGSRLELRFTGWPDGATARLGSDVLALAGSGGAREATLELRQSDAVVVSTAHGSPLATIVVMVRPDAPPDVRITAPGADLRRATATGQVRVRITARDDLGLREVRLLYTRVSGSGESFTFEDGEWPVRLERRSATAWEAEHVVDLSRLGLAPGDSVAYHAVAHDARPGAEGAGESERFLIEIAREGAQAAGDFSLPEPDEKFALSQRMVILLTERLLERRPRMTPDAYRAEAQALAIAQRRVRAEFVFMLGGEVEDEAEEAAHSHEVEAGRLDNRGQGDLTRAVRQMAQAEARLTDADLREALPYEYDALSALQAAFGKARYFMRTLPAPVRLDGARRLQGDRSEAAPSTWARGPLPETQRDRALALLARLEQTGTSVPVLLPGLIALDRADAAWVREVQQAAGRDDRAGIARLLRSRLLAAAPSRLVVPLAASADEAGLAARERRP
ncbi:hypothetical protein TBR22_A25850 [Luteitalea sp. TBR-22]|uniref:DUF4175 domain-containing protein n=1 Tax=Luteitalea sp. TBR-22 TaxID=2802971 RepID=UPI001AF66C9F|nr:DUF4175 domain-containing protein [Luteitalea sp. TBR-22]BCS33358.1 hypothetical protein TBR22_A25850 [Luteitalea sp. TBR-22]